jgi:signal transduction histidine kinase
VHGLYAWLRRHPRLVDGSLAFLLVLLGSGSHWWRHWTAVFYVLLVACLVVPIVFRRRYPVAAFVTVIGAGAVQVLITRRPNGADLAVLIVLYTLAAQRPRRASVRGLVVCLAGAATAVARWHPPPSRQTLTALGWEAALLGGSVLLAWVLGDSIRWRRGYYEALEERARRLERERDALAQVAAAAERARIAREMHDVVAHHVSVMVVQADGAAYALDAAPDKAHEALGVISRTGRQALTEMRRLLGVLRTAGPAELGPMPGVGELDALLDQTRSAGIPVSVALAGRPRPLPGGADLAAYRIVQESLTNVRKHGGPGVSASVTVRYGAQALTIRVADDGRGAAAISDGAGHGLAGMRERVELYGGSVTAGPRLGGGFQVIAELPLGPAETELERTAVEARGAA